MSAARRQTAESFARKVLDKSAGVMPGEAPRTEARLEAEEKRMLKRRERLTPTE